jgi:hypothetical protein
MGNAQLLDILISLVGVLAVGVLVPLLLVTRSTRERREDLREAARMHREDRDAEWARQDLVAEKAERARIALAESQKRIADQAAETASLLVAAQEETIRRTNEVADLAAARDAKVSLQLGKIDAQAQRIHTLVNSDMTAARQSERDGVIAMAAVLRKVIALAVRNGLEPDPADVQALEAAERRANELDQILADRLHQQRVIEAEAAKPGAVDMDSPAVTMEPAGESGT